MKLSPERLQSLNVVVSRAVSKVAEWLGEEHTQKGGYFRLFLLASPTEGHVGLEQLYEAWVGGHSNREKKAKYQVLSFEKAIRLAQEAAEHPSVVSSFQANRNTLKNLFGGTIRVRCVLTEFGSRPVWLVFSFSGLPEFGDETAMLLSATNLSWQADKDDIDYVIQASENGLARQILAA